MKYRFSRNLTKRITDESYESLSSELLNIGVRNIVRGGYIEGQVKGLELYVSLSPTFLCDFLKRRTSEKPIRIKKS